MLPSSFSTGDFISLETTGWAEGSGRIAVRFRGLLWETTPMAIDRKKLVIDTYYKGRPSSAHCQICGKTFRRTLEVSQNQAGGHIYAEFDNHECKDPTVNQSVAETKHPQ